MAVSRVSALRSVLRFWTAASSSVLQSSELGTQLGIRRASELGECGLSTWTRRMATSMRPSEIPRESHLNKGTVGQVDHGKIGLNAAVTKVHSNIAFPLSSVRAVRGQTLYSFAAPGTLNAAGNGWGQQLRTIMVEVKKNDLDRAIRRWRRKCKEENLKSLKDREYYRKPSEKRVLALKERDHRIMKRAFKQKLNWIMSRRQRGF